jgi:MFS family permease
VNLKIKNKMEITLDKAGFLARYYEWTFKKEVPNWLCPYFWVIVFLVVLFPIVLFMKLIIYLIRKFKSSPQNDEEWEKNYLKRLKVEDMMISAGMSILILICIFSVGMLGFGVISFVIKHGFLSLLKMLGVIGICVGMAYLFLLGILGLVLGLEKIKNSKKTTMIFGMIKSVFSYFYISKNE